MNLIEYVRVLNDIDIICNSVDVNLVCLGGDLNMIYLGDLIRLKS